MADNVTITAGTGTTIAADECPAASGVLVQRVKTTWGPDGTANDTDVATGKPMPVQLRSSTGQALADTTGILISTTQLGTLGPAAMAASVPVTIATNQGSYPVAATLSAETSKIIGTVNITSNQAPVNGQNTKANSTPVVPATDWVYNTGYYVTAAVSATTTLQSSTGATGDYLDHVVVFPSATNAGTLAVIDNATTLVTWPGGSGTALLSLLPFTIYVGAVSRSGAWKLTLGAGVTALAVGRFS
jgi:hypothetical protein